MNNLDEKLKELNAKEWLEKMYKEFPNTYNSEETYKVVNLLIDIVNLQNQKIEELERNIKNVGDDLYSHERNYDHDWKYGMY